jgi:hypothetical protein
MENESRNLILSLNFQLSFNNTNLIKILSLTKFWDVTIYPPQRISSSKFKTSTIFNTVHHPKLRPNPNIHLIFGWLHSIISNPFGIKLSSFVELLPTDQSLIRTYSCSYAAHSDPNTYCHLLTASLPSKSEISWLPSYIHLS